MNMTTRGYIFRRGGGQSVADRQTDR